MIQENQYAKFPTLNNNEFVLLKTLGKGLNSKVKLGFHTGQQKNYAIKIIHAENYQANLLTIQKEIGVLQQLKHPNIINLLSFNEKKPYKKKNGQIKNVTYLVLELGQKGELFDYVANTGYFSEPIARFYFRQLIEAIDYCHSQGVTHRDLKPENLLYDELFNLKVADFGFANVKQNMHSEWNYTKLGTPAYMAPELHYGQPYKAERVDVFAAGIILFILIAGTPPFNEAKKNDPYYKYFANGQPETFWKAHMRFKPKGFFNNNFVDLMNKMLAQDHNKRITIAEIKQHPWYLSQTPTLQEIQVEFLQRHQLVQQALEKERLEKEAEKKKQQAGQNQDLYYAGFGQFRKIDGIDELAALQKEFTNINLDREIKEASKDININSFYTAIDLKYLWQQLILKAKQNKNINDIQLSGSSYKIKCKAVTDNAQIAFNIEVKKYLEESYCIEFQKESGNAMDYYEQIKALKLEISKLSKQEQKSE